MSGNTAKGLLEQPGFVEDLRNETLSGRAIAEKWGCSESNARQHRINLRKSEPFAGIADADSDDLAGGRLNLGPEGGDFDGIKSEKPITDWSDVFRQFNLDPDSFTIDGNSVRMSMWQQSKRTENGDRDVINLYSYRASFTRRKETIDLPALYAEKARSFSRAPLHRNTEARTVIVAWADVQTGKVDGLGGTTELLTRLDQKRQGLADYLERTAPDSIVIADVGDIVEGFDNVGSQIRTNDLSPMDQVDVAATEFWKTIRLASAFAPVTVLSIPSNHAQWRAKGGKDLAGKPTDDWGLHISKRLEHMAEEVGLPVTFIRPATDWDETLTFAVRGTVLGLAHGHQASSPDRVPDWWGKMTHADVMDCDVLLTGHYHHVRVQPHGVSPRNGRARWWLQAPTLDNGSAWVRNKMGEDGDPGLMVFAVDNDGLDLSAFSVL